LQIKCQKDLKLLYEARFNEIKVKIVSRQCYPKKKHNDEGVYNELLQP